MLTHDLKCPVCQRVHGEVQADRGTGIGWVLCKEHTPMVELYVALVEVDGPCDGPDMAKPTGRFVHLLRSGWGSIFGTPVPEAALIYAERGLIDRLIPLMKGDV